MNRLVTLGSKGGPALRPGAMRRMPTSSLLELDGARIVVDCGLGVTSRLVDAGVALPDIDAVFVTHLHSDHVLELGPLLHTAWTSGLSRPLAVHGPPGTTDYVDAFLRSVAFDCDIRVRDEGRPPLSGLIEVREFGEGDVETALPFGVRALRVRHPPVHDCFALRFSGSVDVTFSADTAPHPPLADFARGTDVLVHEAMLVAGVERLIERTPNAARLREHLTASHSTATDAGRIASGAGAHHLVLNHLIPADDPAIGADDFVREASVAYGGPVTVAEDGLEITLAART